MSYDVHFEINGEPLVLDRKHHISGGTYALGGTSEAWLNITYNYGSHFQEVLDGGLRGLYGKKAAEIIPILEVATPKVLGSKLPENECWCHNHFDCYWATTARNANVALNNLLELARMVPAEAVLQGD